MLAAKSRQSSNITKAAQQQKRYIQSVTNACNLKVLNNVQQFKI